MKKVAFPLLVLFLHLTNLNAQTNLTVYPDSVISPIGNAYRNGCFFVPKTTAAVTDFFSTAPQQNCVRTNVIESALNNTTNLTACLNLIGTVQTDLVNLSNKCDKLIFIFEKMPVWLSSSSDGSPAQTPGWYVLNTKPPANWNTWQTVIDSITNQLVNQFGINNAYFEIWNEPDIGSWSGTMDEYFTLYKRTYQGIKSAAPNAKVGGPAVNGWANNIYWKPSYGYLSNAIADSSLIGQLLDSAIVWNMIPDFISCHNFGIVWQEFGAADTYVIQKCASLNIAAPERIVSEWNAPSAIRDTPFAKSWMIKSQSTMAQTGITNHAVAAWQDFASSSIEFHNDYGLLTYGTIHKPAYNSILLSDKLNGSICLGSSNISADFVCSVTNDTAFVLISNYCPPPIVEALNHTLWTGHFSIFQLDSAGYVDVQGNNYAYIDSIYRGLITISNSTSLATAINNSIPTYQHYAAIYNTPRTFNINIANHTGNYTAQYWLIDSTKNNLQYRYDSLRNAGYSQTNAINYIVPNQQMSFSAASVNGGQYNCTLMPNAVALLVVHIPGVSSVEEPVSESHFTCYPNPSKGVFTIQTNDHQEHQYAIYDLMGQEISSGKFVDISRIDLSEKSNGVYLVQVDGEIRKITIGE
jgi:Glycosyl hydrolases family 39/Secretion system C-terminal sorting domain